MPPRSTLRCSPRQRSTVRSGSDPPFRPAKRGWAPLITDTRPTRAPATPVRLPGPLSLVLPAHNEAANIEAVIQHALDVLPAYTDEFEIVVVNDGSRDETKAILERLSAEDSRIKPVHHAVNRGYGGALISGFNATSGAYVMFMDADRQFDIADIRNLSPFVALFEVVAGFRMERNDPMIRRINAELFNLAVRVLFGVHLRDIDCAFKIFDGAMLRSLDLSAPGALINAEIQAKLRRQGATVVQVGVHHYPRVAGTATGGSPRVILRAMWETIVLWIKMHTYQPPASAPAPRPYYALGDALIGAAAVVGAVTIGRFIRRG